MKHICISFLCVSLIVCQGKTQNKVSLKTQKDSTSYMLGMNIGKNFKTQMIEVDPDVLARGLSDILSEQQPLMTDKDIENCMTALQKQMAEKRDAKMKESGQKNRKEGDAFLEANKKKEGIQTTSSGLQYKVIKQGTGPKPKAEQTVSVHYRGTLINGKEFESSYKRNQPTEYPVNGFIKGWIEALQLMPVGSKWELYIPSDLAYGSQGNGNDIGPDAVLIFQIELLAIK